MNRRIISFALALIMIFGSFTYVSAQTGNDKVDWLIEEGLVLGDSGGYRLNDPIRRSEVAAMVTRALDAEATAELLSSGQSMFSDIPASHWANGYINYAASVGYVNGYPDGTFGPDRNISYAEIITILVRTTGEEVAEASGQAWATPYIVKAIELGISADVVIPGTDYNANATREKVFEMVYNTVMRRLQADREVYNAIVVENSRVAELKDNEITVVIMDEGDNSPDATLRYENGDSVDVVLPSSLDPEWLLGKVIDMTIDKDDNVVSAVIDKSFDYHFGPFIARDMEIVLENGEVYDVVINSRSTRDNEKLYAVYHNDEAYDYQDYVVDFDDLDDERDGAFIPEFSRVTVKGDAVYFIDSFMFDDIAPVIKTEFNGEDVYVHTDYESADEDIYFFESVIGFSDGDFITMEINEIGPDDVVHVYGDSAIVKLNAMYTGELERVREANDVFYGQIDGELYLIRQTNHKRPVYSLDGTSYFTLFDVNAANQLRDLIDENVDYILDVNNSLQLIRGSVEFDEKMVMVEDSGTRTLDALDSGGEKVGFRIDNYTTIMRSPGSSGNMSDFYRGVLAYVFYDGNLLDKVVRVASPADIDDDALPVAKTSRGRLDISLQDRYLVVEDNLYDYNANTNIFTMNLEGSSVARLEAVAMEDIVDMADPEGDLRAYIITEKDFSSLGLGNNILTGNSEDLAHTIVFTDFELADDFVDVETLLLEFAYNPSRDDSLTGEDSNGQILDLDVAEFAVLPSMSAGELVEFVLENGQIISATVLIDADSDEYEVTAINSRDGRISLDGEEFWLAKDYRVFNDTSVRAGDTVYVVFSPDYEDEVEIILVK